jgi:hypothetical protein
MESVEKATAPAATVESPTPRGGEARAAEHGLEATATPTAPAAAASGARPDQPWTALLETGLALLNEVVRATKEPAGERQAGPSLVRRDPQTGEPYFRIPMPSPAVVDRVVESLGALLHAFRGQAPPA